MNVLQQASRPSICVIAKCLVITCGIVWGSAAPGEAPGRCSDAESCGLQKNANATVDASPAEHAEAQENNTCCSEPCSPEVTQANRLEAVAVPDSDIVLQLPRIPVGGTPTVDVPEESRRLLDRAFQGSEDVGSGDSLLDGVLQVARERGSILDGSLLETENLPQLEDGPDAPGGVASRSPMRKRAKAALRLLQAAEMLERTRPIDSARSELVAKMRAEAGKLLSQ